MNAPQLSHGPLEKAAERGYSHPVDLTASPGLVGSFITSYTLSGFEKQTVEHLLSGTGIDTDRVVGYMADLTVQRVLKRVTHEQSNLTLAGIESGTAKYNKYRQIAGCPKRTTDFAFWVDDVARDMLEKANRIPGNQQAIRRIKGPSFELGTSIRSGRQGPQFLDVVASEMVGALRSDARVRLIGPNKRIVVPKLLPFAEFDSGIVEGCYVVEVGEAIADVMTGLDPATNAMSVLHLVKKSIGLVVYDGLPTRVKNRFKKDESVSQSIGNLLLSGVERPHEEFRGVIPESTTYYLRRPIATGAIKS
jgi:hypothetical protein